MTEKEAWGVLNAAEEEDDAKDLIDDCLFEIKQFILSKPLISKLIESQIKKLQKLVQVVEVLNIDVENRYYQEEEISLKDFNDSILDTFNFYESCKAQLKIRFLSAESPGDLIELTTKLLQLQNAYSNCWPNVEADELEVVVISKEPDAMELISEIKKINEKGIIAFQQLIQISLDNYPSIKQELKRLSLLRKKETEWKTSLKN